MKTKKEILLEFIKEYSNQYQMEEYPQLTTLFLSEKLNMQRTNISTLLNQLVKEGKVKKIDGRPVLYQLIFNENEKRDFESLIGHDQSLKEAIMLAKAAILYPSVLPKILLTAERGSGIDCFVKSIYEFAVKSKVLKNNAPYIIFDCQSYSENQNKIKDIFLENQGLIQKANTGLLFLKNAHLLDDYLLSDFLQSMQHLATNDKYKCIFICHIDSLQKITSYTLMNELDYTISIPPLKSRSLKERFDLIEMFLNQEAKQIQCSIQLANTVLHSLMLYECSGQIKELKNDIHNACANSYVRIQKNERHIELLLSDFPNHVRKGMIYYKHYKDEIDELVSSNSQYTFTGDQVLKSTALQKEHIYSTIDEKKKELKKQQLTQEETDSLILVELKKDFQEYFYRITENIYSKEQLEKIVSLKLIQDVEDFLNQMSNQYNILFETKTLYGLALHIDTAIIQTSKKQRLSPKEKNDFIQQFPEYYKQTQQFIKKINDDFGIHLPNDEVIMVMLFLICGQEEIHHQEVVTLIAMHGEHTATSIVDVVKKLSGKQSIYGYDLKLDQTINESYEELKEYILHIHQGKGMILIYDMGSIRTMAESIKIELNIDIEFLEIPLTLIAMTSVNKAHELLSLNETYQYLQEHFKDLQYVRNNSQKEALVLISSLESELVQAKNYLLEHFDLKDIEIFLIQESQIESIYNRIDQIANQYKIKGLISRQEINLSQYTMIPLSNVYKLNAKSLDDLFTDEDDLENLFDYLQEQFEDIQIEDLKQPLIHFANKLEIILNQKIDYDTLIGLLIHIICLIDRLKKHLSPAVHFQAASDILTKDRSTVEKVKEILLPIEQICRITISDVEAATIISIIKGKEQ